MVVVMSSTSSLVTTMRSTRSTRYSTRAYSTAFVGKMRRTGGGGMDSGGGHRAVRRAHQQHDVRCCASEHGPAAFSPPFLAVLVDVQVNSSTGSQSSFEMASMQNAINSIQENGISRFDVVQNVDDEDNFVLVEVYCDVQNGPASHKETKHYEAWRDTVADMMFRPRQAKKYLTVFPEDESAWNAAKSIDKSHKSDEDLLCVHVYVSVKPGTESAFVQATLENARNSVNEAGISRFDVLQSEEDATKFLLIEVYKTSEAPAKHKETAHYATWRDTVADMMAEPRSAKKYTARFPAPGFAGWDAA
ncbi:(4S)-4-hydroxy-5-phosphonooxypentane-2,3-dione isomerase [Pseudoscourfieldia marina]